MISYMSTINDKFSGRGHQPACNPRTSGVTLHRVTNEHCVWVILSLLRLFGILHILTYCILAHCM